MFIEFVVLSAVFWGSGVQEVLFDKIGHLPDTSYGFFFLLFIQ